MTKPLKTKVPKPKSDAQIQVTLMSNIEDGEFGVAYNEYRFRTIDGKQAKLRIERAKLLDNNQLAKELMNKNAVLPSDSRERNELITALISAKPKRLKRLAPKVGWIEGHKPTFVRHSGVSGDTTGNRELCPPGWVENERIRCRVNGTLDGWLADVAPIIRWSSRFQLTAAATFAAPLIRLMHLQPFAVAIHGNSGVGKSSAALVAGSIIGCGSKEAMYNWNLTDAGFQEAARHFNDHVLLIDEIGSMDAPRDEQYKRVRNITFIYAEGADKVRHSKSAFATTKDQADAKGILITTSEHSLDALAAFAGQKRDPGELARAFDVPATTNEGAPSVFDIFPSNMDADKRDAWAEKKFGTLRAACPLQHGTAFSAYIACLVQKDRNELVAEVRRDMSTFEQTLDLKTDLKALRHAAKNFAIIYAGGVQAINAKLLPITAERLLKSIIKCFKAGARAIPTPGSVEASAIKQLTRGLKSVNVPSKSSIDAKGDPVGFHSDAKDASGAIVFSIKPATFREWFESDTEWQAALRWLNSEKLLLLRDGVADLPKGQITTENVITFEKLTGADGQRKNGRWIRFKDPRLSARSG